MSEPPRLAAAFHDPNSVEQSIAIALAPRIEALLGEGHNHGDICLAFISLMGALLDEMAAEERDEIKFQLSCFCLD